VLLVGTTDGAPLAVAGGRLGEGTAVVAVGTGEALGSAELAAGVSALPDALGTPELELGPPGEDSSVPRPFVNTTASTTAATTRATAAASNPIRRREPGPEPGEAVDIRTLCAERRTALVGADPSQDNGSVRAPTQSWSTGDPDVLCDPDHGASDNAPVAERRDGDHKITLG
jgi:hypothetical protein